jgi:hypothetical protein
MPEDIIHVTSYGNEHYAFDIFQLVVHAGSHMFGG